MSQNLVDPFTLAPTPQELSKQVAFERSRMSGRRSSAWLAIDNSDEYMNIDGENAKKLLYSKIWEESPGGAYQNLKLWRKFRTKCGADKNGVTLDGFKKGLKMYGLNLRPEVAKEIYNEADQNGNNLIQMSEFFDTILNRWKQGLSKADLNTYGFDGYDPKRSTCLAVYQRPSSPIGRYSSSPKHKLMSAADSSPGFCFHNDLQDEKYDGMDKIGAEDEARIQSIALKKVRKRVMNRAIQDENASCSATVKSISSTLSPSITSKAARQRHQKRLQNQKMSHLSTPKNARELKESKRNRSRRIKYESASYHPSVLSNTSPCTSPHLKQMKTLRMARLSPQKKSGESQDNKRSSMRRVQSSPATTTPTKKPLSRVMR